MAFLIICVLVQDVAWHVSTQTVGMEFVLGKNEFLLYMQVSESEAFLSNMMWARQSYPDRLRPPIPTASAASLRIQWAEQVMGAAEIN